MVPVYHQVSLAALLPPPLSLNEVFLITADDVRPSNLHATFHVADRHLLHINEPFSKQVNDGKIYARIPNKRVIC